MQANPADTNTTDVYYPRLQPIDSDWFETRSGALRAERDAAAEIFRQGNGFLWFLHNQKAAGTTLCKLLESKLHNKIAGLNETEHKASLFKS